MKTFRIRRLAVLLAITLAFATSSPAATYTWVPTTGGSWTVGPANPNWTDGAGGTTWVNGNIASFPAFTAGATITLGQNITASDLVTNGGATVAIQGSTFALDVTRITTAGTASSNGSIDMFAKITGAHDLTYNSTGTGGNQGRLNLKTAADYTGDTFLNGGAYLLSDNVSDALPTTTTLNMTTNATFRIAKVGATQTIAGLVGTGGSVFSTTTGNTLTINTKTGVTTAYSGSLTSSTGMNLTITGAGTQTLSGGTLTYSGATTVSGGTLLLSASLGNTSGVTVSGGTLQSNIANVNLGLGGVGMSAGSITPRGLGTAGSFTLAAGQDFTTTGGSLVLDIDTTLSLDKIVGSGAGSNFSLSNTTLALNLITWSPSDYGSAYTLFNGFIDPGLVSNLSITGYDTTNYLASLNSSGVLSFAAVPEPSSMALLAIGAISLAVHGMRRRRS